MSNEITISDVVKKLILAPKSPTKYVGNLPIGIRRATSVYTGGGKLIYLYFNDNIDIDLIKESAESLNYITKFLKKKESYYGFYDQNGTKLIDPAKKDFYEVLEIYKEKEVRKYSLGKTEKIEKYVKGIPCSGSDNIMISFLGLKNEENQDELKILEAYRKLKYG